ncbi:MAG: prepilin-type N-terminal cleavage/methylation domain-containing protein [Candidatus Dojkabacteria bacterium]
MIRLRKSKKKLKAYSLVEIVVSLGIMGVVMTMLFSVLILSLQITFKILARSVVREEVSNVSSLISRDIRNSDTITNCGGPSSTVVCELILDGEKYQWTKCGDRMCKDHVLSTGNVNVYMSSASIKFTTVSFDMGFSDPTNKSRQNILITLVGAHTNLNFNVNNVLKQTSVSTRNYEL